MGIRTCGLSESIAIHSRTCTGPQVDILLGSFLTYFSAQDFILVSAQFIANLSPYHGRARHEVIKTYKNVLISSYKTSPRSHRDLIIELYTNSIEVQYNPSPLNILSL